MKAEITHAELLRKTADRYSKFGGDENLLVVAIRAGADAIEAIAKLEANVVQNGPLTLHQMDLSNCPMPTAPKEERRKHDDTGSN